MEIVVALVGGLLIGLSLGALGGGGSILAVPVLVYGLDETAAEATTGSLVVVGLTSLIGAVAAYRSGNVMLGRGATFGALGIAGAALGAKASSAVPDDVLLAAFAVLMLFVGGLMAVRLVRHRRRPEATAHEPIIERDPHLRIHTRRALKLLATATVVGLLTGFLGVGGGFLVVPALVLVLDLPMVYAAGTSLVVITMTSAAALGVRVGVGVQPDWAEVLTLTAASAAGAVIGARIVTRTDPRRLAGAFTGLVLLVAGYTASQAIPALV